MNLLLDSDSTPEVSCKALTRPTLMSTVILHAVLFSAILAVQVGMVAQAVTPGTNTAAAVQVA